MTATERISLIEKALECPDGDEETAYEILKSLLSGLKVRHLIVKTRPAGPMKADIVVELDGIEFKASHFAYDTGNGVFDVRDDYSRNCMKRVHR
jgi:Mn-containing catalase